MYLRIIAISGISNACLHVNSITKAWLDKGINVPSSNGGLGVPSILPHPLRVMMADSSSMFDYRTGSTVIHRRCYRTLGRAALMQDVIVMRPVSINLIS